MSLLSFEDLPAEGVTQACKHLFTNCTHIKFFFFFYNVFFPITCFRGSNKCELLIIPVAWLCYGLSPDSVFKPKCWLLLSFVNLLFSIHYSAFTPLKSSSPSILRYIFNKCILTIIYVSNRERIFEIVIFEHTKFSVRCSSIHGQ